MKKGILLFACMFSLLITKAQKNQNAYFFKNNGKEVKVKDSADYVRVIQEPDSGEVNFNFLEFYADGKKKTVGKVSAFEPRLVFEGVIARFNKSGRKVETITYEKGNRVGTSYYFHENGKVRSQREYVNTGFMLMPNQMITLNSDLGQSMSTESKLIYYADSLGKVFVEEGNGHLIETTKTYLGERVEEGDYKDGLKDGVWIGREDANNHTFKETYKLGKLIDGESSIGGKKYTYTSILEAPEFKGGTQAWSNYLSRSIKYPVEAARQGIAGTVVIGFVVDVDGKIVDAKPIKSVNSALDEEARRMLSWSPKWIPAKMRGVPVKIKYSQPIKFTIPGRSY